ncbi:GNAT family N-acetyltransferase [Kribbella sp. NPDC051586]|uniref:GNAT family N-acetyltransferase n=1 Tax=Kribbella sp. NPDC051586 TaxID=3364118 RepID=UPI0037A78F64
MLGSSRVLRHSTLRRRHAYDGTPGAEAAASWIEHGFTTFGLPRIIAVTDTPNVRSIAVMRRLGMSFDHEAVLEEDGVPFDATIYSLTAEARKAWRADRR